MSRRGATVPRAPRARRAPAAAADTRERILQAAETLLRRHGVAKLTVVDVARALDMSHANVYRHFASKTALQDALVERWLQQVSLPLAEIASRPEPAAKRLEAWLLTLIAAKRRKVLDDPELFEAYHAAAEAARGVVEAHMAANRSHLTRIVRDGVAAGEFAVRDVPAAVAAIRDATARFVDPHFIRQTADRTTAEQTREAKRVLALLIAGLEAGAL